MRGRTAIASSLYRPDWYATQLEDLEVLCRGCHRGEHGIVVREWMYTPDLEIDHFFKACSGFFQAAFRPNAELELEELEALKEFAADHPDDCAVQFQLSNVLRAQAFKLEEIARAAA